MVLDPGIFTKKLSFTKALKTCVCRWKFKLAAIQSPCHLQNDLLQDDGHDGTMNKASYSAGDT